MTDAVAALESDLPKMVEPHKHYCHKHGKDWLCIRQECVPHGSRTCKLCRTKPEMRVPKAVRS